MLRQGYAGRRRSLSALSPEALAKGEVEGAALVPMKHIETMNSRPFVPRERCKEPSQNDVAQQRDSRDTNGGEIINQTQNTPWQACITEIQKLNDPLVASIFKQGVLTVHDTEAKKLEITFSKDLLFFQEWLENTQRVWQPVVARFFGEDIIVVPLFTGAAKERVSRITAQTSEAELNRSYPSTGSGRTAVETEHSQAAKPAQQPTTPIANNASTHNQVSSHNQNSPRSASTTSKPTRSYASAPKRDFKSTRQEQPKGRVVTITDPEKWQKAHALLQVFPGTLIVNNDQTEGEGA